MVNQRATIVMSEEEVMAFITQSRTATLASNGPRGIPHLIAMWYAVLDGKVYFETKAKSQKVMNLRRDPHVACMMEAGDTYDQLRGVSIEGVARIIDDTTSDEYWAAAANLFERYNGPYSEERREAIERMMNKRVVVRVDPQRIRSWDHRKLQLPRMPPAGSTATFLSIRNGS